MTIDIGTILIGVAGLISSLTGLIALLRQKVAHQDGGA